MAATPNVVHDQGTRAGAGEQRERQRDQPSSPLCDARYLDGIFAVVHPELLVASWQCISRTTPSTADERRPLAIGVRAIFAWTSSQERTCLPPQTKWSR
jgi:hypothetical protein